MAVGLFIITLAALGIFSYGFTDPNLTLSTNPLFLRLHEPLFNMVYHQRPTATILFLSLLLILFVCYLWFLKNREKIFPSWNVTLKILLVSSVMFVFSYPALTYDLFNYMATAKVAYHYGENPYVVMPVEIPNEPNLAFTRAANKFALYGPVWLLLSAIPHFVGAGNVWLTIIAFKFMNAVVYLGFSYFIWRMTKNLTNVIFFALNPLVLIEVLMNGHNDIYMMVLALLGIWFWQKGKKINGIITLVASWFIKGATLPLIFVMNKSLVWSYWILAAVFFILAPLREELYPWYAVWLIMTASLLPMKTHRFLEAFTLVLSFALELRHLPYMWMGYYEGPGPMLRLALTVVPVGVFLVGHVWIKKLRFFS